MNKSKTALFIKNLNAAVGEWNKVLLLNGRLKIDILFDNSATPRIDAASLSNIERSDIKNRRVLEESAAYKIRTGRSAVEGQSDLLIRVNADYLEKEVWLDPRPLTRLIPVPLDRVDCVSVLVHELFHAFGFNGFRDLKTGLSRDHFLSVFDQYIDVNQDQFLFNGPHTVDELGGPLHLTSTNLSQNLWHHGNSGDGVEGSQDLMNGNAFTRGHRYQISSLDIAIMRDLNLPVRKPLHKKAEFHQSSNSVNSFGPL